MTAACPVHRHDAVPIPRRSGYPAHIEARLRRITLARARLAHRLFWERVQIETGGARPRARTPEKLDEFRRTDAPGERPEWDVDRLLRLVAVTRAVVREVPIEKATLEGVVEQLDMFAGRTVKKWVEEVAPIRILDQPGAAAMYERAVAKNVSLITSIEDRYLADVDRVVRNAWEKGHTTETLRKDIQRRGEVSESRARLLARDQTAKLNSQFTEEKHRRLGLDRYMWSTSGDERVRDRHRDLDGQVFRWDEPPAVGHPGTDYQCRCIARPILDPEHEERLVAEGVARRTREADRLSKSKLVTGEVKPAKNRSWWRTRERVAELRAGRG